mgnify:CR=1 FL=1
MKIATWNINSIRLRKDLLRSISAMKNIDIMLLQETKTQDEFFPAKDLEDIFPHIIFAGEKSYNGVAILSKYPIKNKEILEFYNEDKRHISCEIEGIEIHNFYVPAGGDIPDIELNPKFKHKLQYLDLIKNWFEKEKKTKEEIIIAGDLNIAPLEHDVWSSRQLKSEVSHTDIERKTLLDLQKSTNLIDIARSYVDSSEKLYSWWSYRNRDWKKSNRGRRLDHIWLSKKLAENCKNFEIYKDARDKAQPSDHVPVIIEISR